MNLNSSFFENPVPANRGDIPECLLSDEVFIFPPAVEEEKEDKVMVHMRDLPEDVSIKIVRGCLRGIFKCDLEDSPVEQASVGRGLFDELDEFGINVTDFSYFITETKNCENGNPFVGALAGLKFGKNLKRSTESSETYVSKVERLITSLCYYTGYKSFTNERCLLDIFKPEQFVYSRGDIVLIDVDPLFCKNLYESHPDLSFKPIDYILGRLRKTILSLESDISRNKGEPVVLEESRKSLLSLIDKCIDCDRVHKDVLKKIRKKL